MKLCASCMRCLVDRQEERVRGMGTEEDRDAFIKQVARIIGESSPQDSAPVLVERINEVYRGIFGPVTDYDKIKKEFNELMLSVEPDIRAAMAAGEDPLHTAFVYARVANYIDFGMASSGAGIGPHGAAATLSGLVICLFIGFYNCKRGA